jgi:hypothetical protein
MEAAGSSERLVITYKITHCHNSEGHNHSFHGRENLRFDTDGDEELFRDSNTSLPAK